MMKHFRILLTITLLVSAFINVSAAQDAQAGLNQLKSLSGEWQGTGKDLAGQPMPVSLSYKVVSGGFAVMETMELKDKSMVSVYYQDGERLLMTHYCMTSHHPRMEAKSFSNPDELTFSFLDISNLSDPNAHHINGVVFNFEDQDHLTQRWSHSMQGKDVPMMMEFERVK